MIKKLHILLELVLFFSITSLKFHSKKKLFDSIHKLLFTSASVAFQSHYWRLEAPNLLPAKNLASIYAAESTFAEAHDQALQTFLPVQRSDFSVSFPGLCEPDCC